jgi:hypothetical protein
MKLWLNEKRAGYLKRILEMKAGPPSQNPACSRCGSGRAIWRCKDCTDKNAVCVLCCRNAHKFNIFHRVEKWNGRFYQHGALWQVGVKIFLGHDGKPCPRSAAALSSVREYISIKQNETGGILTQVAEQLGLPPVEVLQKISDALDHTDGSMPQLEREILRVAAEKAGVVELDLLQHLRSAISREADDDAAALQADSDKATADVEVGEEITGGVDGLTFALEEDIDGDNEDWEDEESRPPRGDSPRFLPRPPPADGAGNKFITVVHTNGFHSLPVVWCACPEHLQDQDLQLLDQHLYPSSYDRIKTVFTFSCLDDHRYNYLECKSSNYQYHNKLRRQTCPQCPDAAPNRYKELCRVGRQWRNLKYRKWFWIRHNSNGKRGEMAVFCAACPQDGVNLPVGWEAEMQENP